MKRNEDSRGSRSAALFSSSSSARNHIAITKGKTPLSYLSSSSSSSSSSTSSHRRGGGGMELRSRLPNDATKSTLISSSSSSSLSAGTPPTSSMQHASQMNVMSDSSAIIPTRAKRVKGVKKSSSEKSKRYREKKKRYIANLDLTVRNLREEVRSLVQKSHEVASLRSKSLLSGSLAKQVGEYYRWFQFGIATESATYSSRRKRAFENVMNYALKATGTSNDHSYSFNASTWRELRDMQVAFLHSLMSPDLCFGDLISLDAFVDQWVCWSEFHSWLHFQLDRLEVSDSEEDSPVIMAYGTMQVRFSRRTLEMIFPFALAHERVVQKLIGKLVCYPNRCMFRFTKDPESGRMLMTRYDVEAQIVQGLLKTLGNLQDVALLVQDAQLVDNHIVGEPAWRMKGQEHQRFEQLPTELTMDSPEPPEPSESSVSFASDAGGPSPQQSQQQEEDKLTLQFILS